MSFSSWFLILVLAASVFSPAAGSGAEFAEKMGVLEPADPVYSGFFGGDIDLVGDVLVVGEGGAGRAYIYDGDGHLVRALSSPDGGSGTCFGDSVAVFGDLIVVGEWNATVDGVKGAGLVHFFDAQGNLVESKGSPEPYVNARFGWAMDSDGVRLAVAETGELWRDGNVTSRVYILDGGRAFIGSVERPEVRMGSFGWSVGIMGDVLVVGKPYVGYMGGKGYTHGVVHIWDLGDWGRVASFGSPTQRGFGNFGFRVSVGKDVIGVSEVRADANSTEMAGLVHLYGLDGTLRTTLYPREPKRYGYFGLPVVVCDDYVVVGQAGGVYFYDHGGSFMGEVSEDALAAADFGNDIALDGGRLAVGSMLSLVGGKQYAGAVHLYRLGVDEQAVDQWTLRRAFAFAIVVSAALFVWWRSRRTASIVRV
jgi:hypothetical protein